MIKRNEQGTFTVWALGLCLMLFALSGISIDLWRAYDARRTLHEIADTAARSGASEIDVQQRQLYGNIILDTDKAQESSKSSITSNAELKNVRIIDQQIDVDASSNEVTVEIRSKFSFFLLGFFPGGNDADIDVSSSARPFE